MFADTADAVEWFEASQRGGRMGEHLREDHAVGFGVVGAPQETQTRWFACQTDRDLERFGPVGALYGGGDFAVGDDDEAPKIGDLRNCVAGKTEQSVANAKAGSGGW